MGKCRGRDQGRDQGRAGPRREWVCDASDDSPGGMTKVESDTVIQ